MKCKVIKGLECLPSMLFPQQSDVSVRVEKTKELTTISFADDEKGIMLLVNYDDIKDLLTQEVKK